MADDFVKQLYDYVDGTVKYYLESADNLKGFLSFLARFRSNVSTRNKILTMGYNLAATDVRTKEAWEKQGVSVNDESAMIYNIQQNKEGGYSERVMYDVSVTDGNPVLYERFPSAGFFAERLILSSPCPIVFHEPPLVDNRRASYDPEKGIIEVTCGYKREEHVCYGLLREYSHFYLRENQMQMVGKGKTDEYDRDRHAIETLAISYGICVRYGIEPPEIEAVHPPEGKPRDLLRILEGMDRAIQKISKRIDEEGMEQRRFIGQESEVNQPKERAPAQGRG